MACIFTTNVVVEFSLRKSCRTPGPPFERIRVVTATASDKAQVYVLRPTILNEPCWVEAADVGLSVADPSCSGEFISVWPKTAIRIAIFLLSSVHPLRDERMVGNTLHVSFPDEVDPLDLSDLILSINDLPPTPAPTAERIDTMAEELDELLRMQHRLEGKRHYQRSLTTASELDQEQRDLKKARGAFLARWNRD